MITFVKEKHVIMTKEEIIKETYGEYYEELKQHIDSNGWFNPVSKWKNLSDYFPEEQIERRSYFHRPKSLKGIEDNNGWIKIEGEDDFPKDYTSYWLTLLSGQEILGYNIPHDSRFTCSNDYEIEYRFVTHYQPIIKPLKHIY